MFFSLSLSSFYGHQVQQHCQLVKNCGGRWQYRR